MSDSVGRTVMIAVIAGVLFAGFLALTPQLTAGSQPTGEVGAATVIATLPEVTQSAMSDPIVSVPQTGILDGFDEEPFEGQPDEPLTTTTRASGPEPDGTLSLTVELLGPRDGKETVILEDEDTVEWYFRVGNTGNENLWGVYVYLETFGHVTCGDTFLAPGATTECRATGNVWAGANTADVWVTAWTTRREVAARATYEYFVRE